MQFAAHQTNERRFACSVWAHQDGHATLLDIERYGVDQRATTRPVTDRLRREKSAQTPRPSLRPIKSQRKNGAPIAAVRIPIGISAGATSARARVSALARSAAAAATLSGRSAR